MTPAAPSAAAAEGAVTTKEKPLSGGGDCQALYLSEFLLCLLGPPH